MDSIEALEFQAVLKGISLLTAWRNLAPFQARVRHQIVSRSERTFRLEARPRDLSYVLTDIDSGSVDSFNGRTGELISSGQRAHYDATMVIFEPFPVRLAFPMSLGIWGRSNDLYRIVGGTESPDEIVLKLASNTGLEGVGSLTIDLTRRHAIRLDTPVEKCIYESIEPLD